MQFALDLFLSSGRSHTRLVSAWSSDVCASDLDGYIQHIRWLAEWLGDPGHAEPGSAFPIASDRGSFMGVYAWHGDASADASVRKALGPVSPGPLYLGRAGSTLNKRILRDDLRNTRASTFRRSLA